MDMFEVSRLVCLGPNRLSTNFRMGAGVRPPNNKGGGEAEVEAKAGAGAGAGAGGKRERKQKRTLVRNEAHLGHVQKLRALAKAVGCQTARREGASRALVQAIGAWSRALKGGGEAEVEAKVGVGAGAGVGVGAGGKRERKLVHNEAHLGHVQKLRALAKAVGCQTARREGASRALVQAIGALSCALGIFLASAFGGGQHPSDAQGSDPPTTRGEEKRRLKRKRKWEREREWEREGSGSGSRSGSWCATRPT